MSARVLIRGGLFPKEDLLRQFFGIENICLEFRRFFRTLKTLILLIEKAALAYVDRFNFVDFDLFVRLGGV